MPTVESKMLILFSTAANSNKFYEAKLDTDDNVHVRYGRVGSSGTRRTYPVGGERKYNQLLRQKQAKGYKEAQLDVVDDSQNGDHVIAKTNLIDVALKQIQYLDDESRTLIEEISRENIHHITSGTKIKFDSETGAFRTPLGVVSHSGVEAASKLLDEIEELLKDPVTNETALLILNEQYFVIIPNKVPNAREKQFLIFSEENLQVQRQICSALLDTLNLIEDLKKDTKEKEIEAESQNVEKVFDVEISLVKNKRTINQITKKYNTTKNPLHGNAIMNSSISKIYSVKLSSQQQPFSDMEKEIGNVHQFWHGTRIGNILSIMGRGLLLPSQSPGRKAGAMFGHGLYFAPQSSKSLQYCDGLFWARDSMKRDKAYMFLASVAVGNEEVPPGPTSKKPKKGFHSFWAKPGQSGVMNDEVIVFSGAQARLDYLVEIQLGTQA